MTIIILIVSDHFSSSSHSIENWNECKNIIRYCWCWSAGRVICTWACACDGAGQSDEESPSALHFSMARFNDCGIYWYCSFFILSSPRNYSYFYSNSSSPLNSSDSSHFWDLGFYIGLVIFSMDYWQYWNVTRDSQHVLRMLSSGLPEALYFSRFGPHSYSVFFYHARKVVFSRLTLSYVSIALGGFSLGVSWLEES